MAGVGRPGTQSKRGPAPGGEPGRRQAERRAEAELASVPGAAEGPRAPEEETGPLQALLRTSVTVGKASLSGPRLRSFVETEQSSRWLLTHRATVGDEQCRKTTLPPIIRPRWATRSELSPRVSPPWKLRLPQGWDCELRPACGLRNIVPRYPWGPPLYQSGKGKLWSAPEQIITNLKVVTFELMDFTL